MKTKNKITRKILISDLLKKKPEVANFLIKSGMGCVGCPMAQQETIEDGCKAHGMSDKEIDEIIEKINSE